MTGLVLVFAALVMDGGSLLLQVRDEAGGEHEIELSQRLWPGEPGAGALLWDDEEVPVRSEQERRLLELLRKARLEPAVPEGGIRLEGPTAALSDDVPQFLSRSLEESLLWTRDEIVAFVESEDYLALRRSAGAG